MCREVFAKVLIATGATALRYEGHPPPSLRGKSGLGWSA